MMNTTHDHSKAPDENMKTYDDRLLAYVDILGWSTLIDESISDPAVLNLLDVAATQLSNQALAHAQMKEFIAKGIIEGNVNPSVLNSMVIESTHFSDTFVMSCALDLLAPSQLLSSLQLLCQSLLINGYYTRGAIVAGKLIHRSNVIYGPALIYAYQLEQKVAKYPRIIVSPEALPYFDIPVHVGEIITRFRYLREDTDGMICVDILGFGGDRKDEPRRRRGFEDKLLSDAQERLVNDASNLGRVAKHQWMIRYLQEVISEIDNVDE